MAMRFGSKEVLLATTLTFGLGPVSCKSNPQPESTPKPSISTNCSKVVNEKYYPNGAVNVYLSGVLPDGNPPQLLEVIFRGPLTNEQPKIALWDQAGFFTDILNDDYRIIGWNGPRSRISTNDASLEGIEVYSARFGSQPKQSVDLNPHDLVNLDPNALVRTQQLAKANVDPSKCLKTGKSDL